MVEEIKMDETTKLWRTILTMVHPVTARMDEWSKRKYEELVNRPDDQPIRDESLSFDFRSTSTSTSGRQVSLQLQVRAPDWRPQQDEETGDWHFVKRASASVGSTGTGFSPEEAQDYAQLLMDVASAALAVRVHGIDNPVRELHQTKAQHEAEEAERARRSLLRRVDSLTETLRKGMRVGSKSRAIPRSFLAEIPDGRYEFEDHDHRETRTYVVRLDGGSATLRRVG